MKIAAIVLFFVLFILLVQWMLKRFFPDEGGIDVSKDYVADIIQAMIDGTGQDWDWDDFTSIPIKDPYLDEIRQRCARLWQEYPPDREADYCGPNGVEIMQSYVAELRSA
jgi:hypothetical protein